MIMDMISWHKMMNDKKITLIYSGPLWSEGIGGLAGTLKWRFEIDQLPLHTSQEVFSVFVEQMNNMLMYSSEKTLFKTKNDKETSLNEVSEEITEAPKGTFILGKDNNKYFIQTGNVMKNESIELIKNRINYLNTLDKNELRKFYKEQTRLYNNNPESKGAGLGFIEIARRISSKIEYSFTPYDEGHSFFSFYVTIGGEENVI